MSAHLTMILLNFFMAFNTIAKKSFKTWTLIPIVISISIRAHLFYFCSIFYFKVSSISIISGIIAKSIGRANMGPSSTRVILWNFITSKSITFIARITNANIVKIWISRIYVAIASWIVCTSMSSSSTFVCYVGNRTALIPVSRKSGFTFACIFS